MNAGWHLVVKSMIGLAHALDTIAVAEGVENPAQLRILTELECDAAQGFLFCHPLSAVDITPMLTGHTFL